MRYELYLSNLCLLAPSGWFNIPSSFQFAHDKAPASIILTCVRHLGSIFKPTMLYWEPHIFILVVLIIVWRRKLTTVPCIKYVNQLLKLYNRNIVLALRYKSSVCSLLSGCICRYTHASGFYYRKVASLLFL